MRTLLLRWLFQRSKPEIQKMPSWWAHMQQRMGYQEGWQSTTWTSIRDEVAAHPEMCDPDVKPKWTAHITRILIDQEETLAEAHFQWWSGDTIQTVAIDQCATIPMLAEV